LYCARTKIEAFPNLPCLTHSIKIHGLALPSELSIERIILFTSLGYGFYGLLEIKIKNRGNGMDIFILKN
jgi:hypothetical protein